MRVHPMEVQLRLKFTDEEETRLAPSFAFGDAEEQLSYAVDQLGSERVATLIVDANDSDIGIVALTDVDGFSDGDKVRIKSMLEKHGVTVSSFTCRWCGHRFESESGRFCPRCYRFQTDSGQPEWAKKS